jgi:hypothetical protein
MLGARNTTRSFGSLNSPYDAVPGASEADRLDAELHATTDWYSPQFLGSGFEVFRCLLEFDPLSVVSLNREPRNPICERS